jgi:hypothetical protein
MDKGKNYQYSKIEEFAEANDYDINEHGNNRIGENFLVLEHREDDKIISFVLTGAASQYIYECVYSNI